MIRPGHMVRHANGPLMLVRSTFRGMARLWWIDSRGRVRQHFAYIGDLLPLSLAVGPRSLWPEANTPLVEEVPPPVKKFSRRARKSKRAKVRDQKPARNAAMTIDTVLRQISDWRAGKIWGAPAIAKEAGVSEDTVREWAKNPSCPVSKVGGRFFVTRGALQAWMTKKLPA
jgi:hypothetical protein